jgi:pullulanase/glycogen debranching enzyme
MVPTILPGKPYPLGATWEGTGVNFAVYSENATKVELCLYDNAGGSFQHRCSTCKPAMGDSVELSACSVVLLREEAG